MRKKGSLAEWELRRNLAINLLDQGMQPAAVAKAMNVDPQTVRAWRRAYRARGRGALASRKPSGRPARLTFEQRLQLSEMLLKTPLQCGFGRYLWTQQLIADLVQREFGVSYHHDHIGVILQQIGFTHQKPARRARERDEAKTRLGGRRPGRRCKKKPPQPTG
jgi:transposase